MCDIYAMVGSLCGSASIWSMTAIALDRYNVIVKVHKYTLTIFFDKQEQKLANMFTGDGGKTTYH